MPAYELLCLVRPVLSKQELQRMIHKVGSMVYGKGGVITNVQSYGEQMLAYKVSNVHGKYDKAQIWQLDFAVNPQVLREINREMRINEDVLRWVVKKLGTPRQAVEPDLCSKLRAFAQKRLPSPRIMFHYQSPHASFLRPPPRFDQLH
eukprot:gene11111-11265_t